MSDKKDIIEYALHAYDTFWEYYKKTLDERNQILNNYIIFVGIPVSIVGLFIEKSKYNFDNYYTLISFFLCIIFVLGIVIYGTYIIESFVSQKYLHQINHITEYLIKNFNSDYQDVFKEAYALNNLFLNKVNSQRQRINKSFIIIILNTIIMIFISLLLFNNNIQWYHIILSTIFSTIIHIAVFIYYKRHIEI